jgi:hypothetical protein
LERALEENVLDRDKINALANEGKKIISADQTDVIKSYDKS